MIRPKISARLDGDQIQVTLDWISVTDNQPGESVLSESWRLPANRPGVGYVSRVASSQAEILPGTFWLDEVGLRHFYVPADAEHIEQIGKPAMIAAMAPGA